MKAQARLLFVCLLGLTFSLRVGFGQVYFVNAVGYVNIPIGPGLSLIGNPLFNADNNRISTLFKSGGQIPDGAMIHLLRPDEYLTARFDAPGQQWLPAEVAEMEMLPGEGFFFFNPSSTVLSITFVGEILQGTLTNPLPSGYSIRSSMVPQAGTLDVLQFPAEPGDCIFIFNGTTQKYAGYSFDEFEHRWIPEVPRLQVGEAFIASKSRAADWTRIFFVNQ